MRAYQRVSVFLMALLLTLAACGTAPPAAAPTAPPADAPAAAQPAATADASAAVELTFANWMSTEDATKPAYEAMIAAFEAKYPNISVTTVGYPFNQMRDQLLVSAAGGTPPDVAQVHSLWIAPLADANLLQPLEGLLDQATLDDYYPTLLNGKRYNGDLLAVSWAPSPIILYYNKALLEKAGVAVPQTWDELLTAARAVATLGNDAGGNKIYGLGISSKKLAGAGYFFLPFLWNRGAELVDADGKVVLDSPEAVTAFSEVAGLFKDEITPSGVEIKDLRNLFAQGQLGFHFDGEFGVGIFNGLSPKGAAFADDYGIMQVPGNGGSPGQTFMVEHNLAVFKDAPHANEAKLLIEFLTSAEGLAIYNANNGNKLPARTSAANLPFYKEPQNAFMSNFITAVASARPLPAQNAQFSAAMETLSEAIQRVGITGEEPAAVVKDTAAKIATLYKQ
jgi:multiple sugar transport system substrate-binding protein